MTESQAWRILAEEYDAGRTQSRFLCINLELGPLACQKIAEMPRALRQYMIDRIKATLPEGHYTAYDGEQERYGGEYGGRIMACLLFSEIARTENRENYV